MVKLHLRFGVWRSLVSVLPWGGRGRGFKSRHSDHFLAILHNCTIKFANVAQLARAPDS